MRNHYVDYLRGVSILIVLLIHFMFFPDTLPGFSLILKVIAGGFYGVTMFFVVSGYLITSRTLRRYGTAGAIAPREFYAMRAARIGPCLLLSLALLIGLNAAGAPAFANDELWTRVLYAVTFRYNLYYISHGNQAGIMAWDVLWSLSIEEVFYLAFPLVCRLYRKTLLVCILLVIVVINGPWYRHDHFLAEGNSSCVYTYLGCFDAIAIGCLTAIIAARYPISRGRTAAWVAAGGAVLAFGSIVSFPIGYHFVIGPTCVACGAGVYLFAVHGRTSRPAVPRPLGFALGILAGFGILSYEIYLFHGFLIELFAGLLGSSSIQMPWPILGATFGIVLFCLSFAIHRYYAEPLGRSLRRLLGGQRA